MKRGAERQLGRDDEPDVEEVEPTEGGFRKADDAILATRKIKGMPRRLGGGDADKPATPPPAKFAGFGTAAPNPFVFTPPTASPNFPSSAPTVFGTAQGSPTPITFNPASTAAPVVAPTATAAAKSFASFLGDAPKPPATPPATDSAELKYYKSLRGLNVSILDFLQKSVDQDPFLDLGSVLSEYNAKRADIKKDFDGASSKPSSPFGTPTVSAQLKMPTAPPSFAGFGSPASTTAKANGVTAAPPSVPTSGFSFAGSTPKAPAFSTPAASPFGTSNSSNPTSTFSFPTSQPSAFGSNPFTSTATSPSPFGAPKAPSTGFSFGGTGGSSSSIGFSFGGASPKPASADTKNGASSVAADDDDGETTEPATSQETASEKPPGSSFFTPDVPSTMDAEGEGEEDEETVAAGRVKAYRMKKDGEKSDVPWIDMGIGFVRLKKHKETSARRLLLRNSHSGKVQINFSLYSGFKPTVKAKALSFMGHDETGAAQMYNVRFKTELEAADFDAAIAAEVAKLSPAAKQPKA
ncbi:RanBD1 domain-containing protein [Mycena kentingensis (nom. inval.)]|nr:RanBD1 domain-containing protein [Mycena kentingensis (nom. inval.)]